MFTNFLSNNAPFARKGYEMAFDCVLAHFQHPFMLTRLDEQQNEISIETKHCSELTKKIKNSRNNERSKTNLRWSNACTFDIVWRLFLAVLVISRHAQYSNDCHHFHWQSSSSTSSSLYAHCLYALLHRFYIISSHHFFRFLFLSPFISMCIIKSTANGIADAARLSFISI